MTPQELHLSVLERAFQGKLTEQSPDDGTGVELLETIKAEKLRLIKSKIIKKEQEQPVITDDDIPFDIPENWAWAYVGDIFLHNTGKAQNSSGSANGIIRKFITTSNLYWNRFDFSKVKEMPFTEKELERCTVRKGDLLVCEGGDCGRSAIWTYDEEVCIQNHVHRLRPYFEISVEYFYHLFYLYKFTGKLRGRGVGIQGLSNEAIHQVICPLPPLAEQKRIVEKIEELLPLIDRYEQAWNRLEDFNKRFPVDMQKSILQMAVQGKLVEQRPEEGTGEELYQQIQTEKQELIKADKIKKEKPLPEIAEDEIPFDIPESWKWVRIGSLLHKLVDGTHRTPKYTTSGVPFVSVRNMSNGTLSLEDTKFISEEEHRELWNRCNPQRGDILLSKVGTTGVPAKVETDKEFSLFVSVALLKFNNDLLDIDFLIYSILAPDFQKQCKEHTRGVGNKNWVIIDIANTMMPLPPLAEQKRIVAKLEEILPLCERLK